jgi:hypothetical protein
MDEIAYIYRSASTTRIPITTLTLDEVNYILELLHKELDVKGLWGSVEESALETMETIQEELIKNSNN